MDNTLGTVTDSGQLVKMEVDYSAACDEKLPGFRQLAADGKLDEALTGLMALEKQTRTGADMHSTSRVLVTVVQLCFQAKQYQLLNEHVLALAKRRSQLKQAVGKMVQEACSYVEQLPEKELKLKLIDTLRTVTEGKIYVEVERARLTHTLAQMREADGNVDGAAEIMQELQVETYGSMERREKVTLILEQMRLCLLRKDFIRTQIISKKINVKFFQDAETSALKLKFYELMIQLDQQLGTSLAICRHYLCVYNTPSVQEDPVAKLTALRHALLYLVLAAHDPEQADLTLRVLADKTLEQLPEHRAVLQLFTDAELIQWRRLEQQYEGLLRDDAATDVFGRGTAAGEERWKQLRRRVVEHNIGVMARCYRRVKLTRMAELLELKVEDVEERLSQMVVAGAVQAKTDRLDGIVSFVKSKDPTDVLTEWSSDINALMSLLNKTTHLINKEEMVHKHLVVPPVDA